MVTYSPNSTTVASCLRDLKSDVYKTLSAERERWIGWEGERWSRFLGSLVKLFNMVENSGLSSGR